MHDVLVIGTGPSGLAAHLYATMYGLDSVCIGETTGGKLLIAPHVSDYPGIVDITGKEFVNQLLLQLSQANAAPNTDRVSEIKKVEINSAFEFQISCDSKNSYQSKTIILATGNPNKQAGDFAYKLGVMLQAHMQNKRYEVQSDMRTSVPGAFASGDAIAYPYSFEQLGTAVSTGIKAAGGVYQLLKGVHPPILWGKAKIPRFV